MVSDTGPLIALAKADCLPVLEQLFEKVHIPPVVHRELLGKRGPEAARLEAALTHFIEVAQPPPPVPEVQVATWRLDAGEQQAIGLAHALGALLAIDDRQGRRAARALGLSITGVVGILIRAKEADILTGVRPVLDEIRRRGYWLSDELVDRAVSAAGEDGSVGGPIKWVGRFSPSPILPFSHLPGFGRPGAGSPSPSPMLPFSHLPAVGGRVGKGRS